MKSRTSNTHLPKHPNTEPLCGLGDWVLGCFGLGYFQLTTEEA